MSVGVQPARSPLTAAFAVLLGCALLLVCGLTVGIAFERLGAQTFRPAAPFDAAKVFPAHCKCGCEFRRLGQTTGEVLP